MNQAQLPYVAAVIRCSTFLASVSQVLLKKAALRERKSLVWLSTPTGAWSWATACLWAARC